MERTKRKSSVYNDCVPYGGRVPNFKEKEGMKLKKEQFDVTGMTCSACSARIEKSVSKLPGIKEVSVNLLKNSMVASYDESILSKEISKVSVRVKNEHIESVLKKVFKNTDISYRIVDNRIFLQDNAKTENVSFASVQQVKRTIRGTVVDNTGLPVIGANVIVKGSAGVGTVTNVDGDFTLEGIEDGATLMISYIGYVDQEVAVAKGKNDYKITIHEDTQNLDEVVVVGYGTQTKVNLTGAVSTIGKDELINRPVTNVSSALQGLTPGVTITSGTGQPGSDGSTIRVRGVGTLNNANPYILVDGIETGTSIRSIRMISNRFRF